MKKSILFLLAFLFLGYVVYTAPAVYMGLCTMCWSVGYDACAARHELEKDEPIPVPAVPYVVDIPQASIPSVSENNKYIIDFRDQKKSLATLLTILGRGVRTSSAKVVISPMRTGEVTIVVASPAKEGEQVVVRLLVPWAVEDTSPQITMR